MWIFLFFSALICYLGATDTVNLIQPNLEEWKTEQYRRTLSYIKLPGVVETSDFHTIPSIEYSKDQLEKLPESFDGREKWPSCPSLKEIRNQGMCGSCWAISSASVMTDRYCIYSNGTQNFHFSAEDILTCSQSGDCRGGDPSSVFKYWSTNGFVSGGNYGSHEGCKPYTIPFSYDNINSYANYLSTPECTHACIDGYNVSYADDKKYGDKDSLYHISGEVNMMTDLFRNGPLVASFDSYEDFANYTSGVYRHKEGKLISGHAVKLIGWGVEDGDKYWLIANSWGTNFGEKGYFKILRGSNECHIEDLAIAGAPRLSKK